MAETYKVLSARDDGEKDNPHGGKLRKWYLRLEDTEAGDAEVYCQKKPDFQVTEGTEIYGTLKKGEYGWRLYPEQNPNGSQTRPQGFSGGRTPRDSGRIERQHSQEMAIRVLASNLIPSKPGNPEQARRDIKEWTDWFVQDLDAGGGSPSNGTTDSPASSAAPSSADHKKFTPLDYVNSLLVKAGVETSDRLSIQAYLKDQVSPEGVSAIIDKLKDGDDDLLSRMLTAAMDWERQHSDLPFDDMDLEEGNKAPEDIAF